MIGYGKQSLDQSDIDAVVEVLDSDFLTQGPVVQRFESALKKYCGAEYGVACSNGTAALHIACLALGVKKGDLVWTVPNTFVASANCALFCGASVDFVDIDISTLNISLEALKDKLQQASLNGKLPKAIVIVHFAGNPCRLKEIASLLQSYGVRLIEDACHALGAAYGEEKIGSCRYSDVTVFSFHPVKSMTSGEGGMLLTNDANIANAARSYSNHGVTRNQQEFVEKRQGEVWRYEQQFLGFNYRLSDIHSALGISQLKKLDDFVLARNKIAGLYQQRLAGLPLLMQEIDEGDLSAFHLFVVMLDGKWKKSRLSLYKHLVDSGVVPGIHYIPVHTQPYYQALGFSIGDFPEAENYYEVTLSLPIYPGLTDAQIGHVVSALEKFFNHSKPDSLS